MNELTPLQVRVLGCLMEKKETTPDQYPLTLNALRNACNQKTSRYPVTDYSEGEIGHCLRELEGLELAREEWGARSSKHKHLVGKKLGLHSPGIALMCCLMLRGPQTLGELKTHSQRLYAFDDLDDVRYALEKLQKDEFKLVVELPRAPGQKEQRFAHLLSGEPDEHYAAPPDAVRRPVSNAISDDQATALEKRIVQLEAEVASLKGRMAGMEER